MNDTKKSLPRVLIRPIRNKVIVDIIDQGEDIVKGIIRLSDDFKESGIRPREAVVLAVGPDAEDDLEIGQHILIPHGDWTRKFKVPCEDGSTKWVWATESERVLMVLER
jgi:co-chaperonin GroES (HSP10)